MDLSLRHPENLPVALRAIKTVATASAPLTEGQRAIIDAVQRLLLHTSSSSRRRNTG